MTENEKLRALLAEARAITQDSLDSNTTGFEAENEVCKCNACERYRSIIARIDAALAEPVGDALAWQTAITKALLESQERLAAEVKAARAYAEERNDEANKLQRYLNMAAAERDEARAEIERMVQRIATLENALASISLSEYESTSSVSEKLHGHARIARKALYGKDEP